MADTNTFFQIFTVIGIIGIFISFIVRVSFQALILKYFLKKYKLPQNYGKAWLVIFFPSLIITFITLPLALIGFPDFLAILISLLFFPLLILSIKLVYKTETNVSAAISLKYFILVLIIVILFAGIQTILGMTANPLGSNVPQSVCTLDCEFAFSLGGDERDLFVTGYDIPQGKFGEKEDYILDKKTFSKNTLNSLKTGNKDVNGDERVIGKLDSNGCNFMTFSYHESISGGGGTCKTSSKSFFTNFKNILVG